MKPRVLFVLNASGGGATQGIKEYLKYQNFQDIDAFLVLPNEPNKGQKEWIEQFCKDYIVISMPWWNMPNGLPWYYSWTLYIKNLIKGSFRKKGKDRIKQFAIDHGVTHIYTGSILVKEGALAAKDLGLPHFWHIKETFGKRGRVKFPMSDRKLQRQIISFSDSVICMTEYIKSFFYHFPENPKLKIISDGINPRDFMVDEIKGKSLREKYQVRDNEVLIGMVASFSSIWKNHKVFIEAASLLKDVENVKFIAFGPEPKRFNNPYYNGPANYFDTLKKYASRLLPNGEFIWAGFHSDIPAIFNSIDIFVHPCEIEPFGRVVIEAMASSKPVVVPKSGGISEPVTSMRNGVKYEPNDAKDLSQKLRTLINTSALRAELGKKAAEDIAASAYTLESYRKEKIKLFS